MASPDKMAQDATDFLKIDLTKMTPDQKARFQQAKELEVTGKINFGDFDSVGLNEVRELFKILDADGSGQLDSAEIRMFLHDIMNPPCPDEAVLELFQMAQETSGGKINAAYFYSALTTGPMRQLICNSHRSSAVAVLKAPQAPITRDFMEERFEWRISRDESFVALPFSFAYLTIFVALVITHLRIWDRQQVERAQEGHIAGWGFDYIGPYLQDHLPNLDQVYAWAETSGMQFAFGYCGAAADNSVGAEFCEIAPRNMLISDVMLKQDRSDGVKKTWLLHSDLAKKHLNATPGDFYNAGLMELKRLRSIRWFDRYTDSFEMHFVTYNDDVRLFTVNEVQIQFDASGYATHAAYSWAVPAEAYDEILVLIADAIYVILLLIPTKAEVLEICHVIRAKGWTGFKGYWGFWNVVDWIMIVNGLAIIQIWLQLVLSSMSSNIQGVLTGSDYKLKKDAMSFDVPTLEALRTDLDAVMFLGSVLHTCMALNVVAIMMKFFKAFQSNARLQVVTETLTRAAGDMAHFMIVFTSVFIGFVLTGHIVLGGDIMHFRTFGTSFNTAFLALMGDFGWYSDLTEQMEPLASGLPYTVVSLWFWSFMVFALQILLNMLLAIIMDNYAAVTEQLNQMPDAPTLLTQSMRFYKRTMVFRRGGFTSLHHLYSELVHGEDVHPEGLVTNETMTKAFTGIKPEQVKFLMAWLQKDANALAGKEQDPLIDVVKRCHGLTATIAENMHTISVGVMHCNFKLESIESRQPAITFGDAAPVQETIEIGSIAGALPTEPAAEPLVLVEQNLCKGIAKQLEEQRSLMKALCEQLAKQQRLSENMAGVLASLWQGPGQPQYVAQPPQPAMRQGQGMRLPACCAVPANAV